VPNVLLVLLTALIPLAIVAGATVLVKRNRQDLYYRAMAEERARAARDQAARDQAARDAAQDAAQDRDGSAGV